MFGSLSYLSLLTDHFSVKQLSTQAAPTLGGVSAAVASAAASVSGGGGVAAGVVAGSPEYRGRSRVNLAAGGELLEAYQAQWERIHLANEKNARMATRQDSITLINLGEKLNTTLRC